MKQLYKIIPIFFLMLCSLEMSAGTSALPPPVVDFTFTNGNMCSGTTLQFTSNVTGATPVTYLWDFGDTSTSTLQNPPHAYSAVGCGTATFTVSLTVTDVNGEVTVRTKTIDVKRRLVVGLADQNVFSPFSNCPNNPTAANPNYTIVVDNISAYNSCTTTYTLNWGDGLVENNLPFSAFPKTHTYTQLGAFNLSITAIAANTCNATQSYTVANQSNPAGGLGTLGSTTGLCAPATVPFTITNWELNSPGTTYELNFGDGQSITLTHPLTSNIVNHLYTTSSCPNSSFTATLNVINSCDTTPYTAGNIQIREKPNASFTNPITACISNQVCFTNTSDSGSYGAICNSLATYVWNFGDPASPSNTVTVIGALPQPACHLFSAPGTYTVSLSVTNPSCGTSTFTNQICIEGSATPAFTLSTTNGCTPLSVITANTTTVISPCTPITYQWNVNYAAGNCGTSPANNFYTGGTGSTSPNPTFNFITPGSYSISLTATNSCGSVTSAAQTVIVKKPPTASINAIPDFCGIASITPTAAIISCAPSSEAMTYAWSFPGGSPSTSNAVNPGTVTYSTPGPYTVSLTVTNSCGSVTATEPFTINVSPTITNTPLTQSICSGMATSLMTLTATPNTATFSWTATASPGISGFVTPGTGIIPVQTLVNSGTSAGTVTYTITPQLGNCPGPAVNYVITVIPAPVFTTQPASSTVCVGGNPTPLSVTLSNATSPQYQWYVNTTLNTTTGTLIPGATASTYNPPATTAGIFYYYAVISLPSGGCASITSSLATVTITPSPSITLQPVANQNLCVGVSIASPLLINFTGGTGTATYQWYTSAGTNSGGTIIPGATSASYTPPVFSIAGTYYYYAVVTMSGNGCGSVASAVAAVNVSADPIITTQPLMAQNLCQNATPTTLNVVASGGSGAMTYQWYSNTSNNTTSGTLIPSAVGSTFTPSTASIGTIYYYCIVGTAAPGCSVVSATAAVTVIQSPAISQQPVPSTVCINGIPILLTVAYVNGTGVPTYQWFSNTSSSNTGGVLIPGATTNSYAPPSTAVGTIYYYAVVTFPSGGGCSDIPSNPAAVTVTPPTTITLQPVATQSLCVGGSIALPLEVGYSGGTGTASFQWYSNTTNSTTGGTSISGASNATYTPTAFTTAGTYYYYATVSLNGSGCGPATSQSAIIVVVPDPVVDIQPLTTQTVCQGAVSTTLSVTTSGGIGSFSYQWYQNSSNNNTSGTAIAGANLSTYIPNTNSVGTIYYYCVISQPGAIACEVRSATATVIVNLAPTFVTQPQSASACEGGILNALTVTYINGTGSPTYQWYSNSVSNTSTGTAVSGATNASFTPNAVTAGTTFYYVIIALPATGGCSSITSAAAEIIITPGAAIDPQPLPSQTLCVGGTVASPLHVGYTGGIGIPSWQWYSNTTNSNTGGVLITGATTTDYTPPLFTSAGTYFYYAIVTLNGNGCGPATSQPAEIVVVPDPVVVLQPLTTQTVCQSAASSALTVTASGGIGSYTYQWYQNTLNNNASGTAITGATSATYTPDTAVVGTSYYYCVISQPNGIACEVHTATAAVIVNLAPTFTTQPLSASACEGAALTSLSVTYINGTGTPTYQWYSNTLNDTTSGVAIVGETGASFTPGGSTAGTVFYYVIVSLPATGGCSSITSDAAEINITPGAAISQQPMTIQTLCVGGTIAAPLHVDYTGGTGTPSWQWYSNAIASNSGGTLIPGATTADYTPPVFANIGTFYFYAVVSLSGNGCGPIATDIAAITVVTDPIVGISPASQILCQNVLPQDLAVTANGGVQGMYAYQWFSNAVDNNTSGTLIAGANGNTFTPPTNTVGTTYYYCIITQPNGPGCEAASATTTVTVNLAPAFTLQPVSSIICLGQAATMLQVAYINGAGIPQYQWFSNTTNAITGAVPVSGAVGPTFNPPVTAAGTAFYFCVVTLPVGGCSDITSDIVEVTVNPNPEIAAVAVTICSSAVFTVTPVTSGSDIVPIGTTYTWGNPVVSPAGAVTGASAEAIPQTSISQTLINTTTSPATVTYTITPISGNCTGIDFTVTVTVNPSVNPNVTVVGVTCFGADNGSITTNITGGIPFSTGVPYQVTWTGPNGYTSTASSITLLAPGIYNLTINDAGGCPVSENYTILEPADIVITTDVEKDITCFGDSDGAVNITITGGTGAYSYTWTKDNQPFASSEDLSNLSPASYTVLVTDANNCGPKTATFTITEPPLLTLNLSSQTNVLCFGASTGEIDVTISGGTPVEIPTGTFDYLYSWTGPNGFVSALQDLSGIVAGTYNLTVTDGHGCFKSLVVTITQPDGISIIPTTTAITCYGANDASISLAITGGVAPYIVTWSNLATGPFQDNLAAGTYVITVTDATNCPQVIIVIIPEAPLFLVNPIVTGISCFGANDASINLNFVGGIAPVVLTWNDGSTSGTVRNNLGPGTYTVTIIDGVPCTITRTFNIIEPQALVLTANTTNAFDCIDANSGAINLLVAGGTPPFTYSWSNGSVTEDLSAISAGNYQVTVSDANGCSRIGNYVITRQAPIVIVVDTDTDVDCEAHNISQKFIANVSGGVPPYNLLWSSGTVSGANNEFMQTNINGTVLLTVTDSFGCTANHTVVVDTPEIGEAQFTSASYAYSTYGIYSISDPVQFTNEATGDYTGISWDFGDGTFSTEENPQHVYVNASNYVVTQTVTYPFGCIYIHKISLIVEKGYLLIVPTAFTPNGDGLNDTFRPVTKALKNVRLDVYDTWGSLIYSETGDVLIGWDGKIRQISSENGNYYCKVTAETFYGTIVNENHPFVLIK